MTLNLIETKNKQKFTRRELLIGFTAIFAIAIRLIFPAKLNGEIFWVNLALFFIFPWLVIRFLLKENLANFGISWGIPKKGIIFSALALAVFFTANYFILSSPTLRNQLQISPDIVRSFLIFLLFELLILLPIHFFWEFFFRGFLQFSLEKRIGYFAILVQALAQTFLYLGSSWLVISLVLSSALFAGLIARASRSIAYSFVVMWLISISFDIMMIRLIYRGTL